MTFDYQILLMYCLGTLLFSLIWPPSEQSFMAIMGKPFTKEIHFLWLKVMLNKGDTLVAFTYERLKSGDLTQGFHKWFR